MRWCSRKRRELVKNEQYKKTLAVTFVVFISFLWFAAMGKVGFLMSVFVCVLCVSEAAVYPVGDEQGWKEYVNYTEWIASKTFFVGDIIGINYIMID